MPKNNNKRDVARHILPTAANLLGLCFVILSYIRIVRLGAETIIDESLGSVIILFLLSCIFSYTSMRSHRHSEVYEKVADIIFLIGLSFLTLVAMLILFKFAT